MHSDAYSLDESNGGVASFKASSSGETTIQVTPYSTTDRKEYRRSSDMAKVAQKVEQWIEKKQDDGQNVSCALLNVPTVMGENVEKKSFCIQSVKIPCICLVICSVLVFSLLAGLFYVCLVDFRGPPCEESWIWVGGRCYFFSDESKSWNDSLRFCAEHGSTLAVLRDQEIQKTIERYRENVNYWIGLSMNQDGRWVWTDGFLNDGSVDNQNISLLRCAYLNSHLGALHCSTLRQWICVKDSAR